MLNIGFIGLGNMGGPMASNLVRADYKVSVFDLVPAAMTKIADATATNSPQEAGEKADVIISMLPAGRHVRSLYLGDNDKAGLLETLRGSPLLIDCSTIDPASAREVAFEANRRGYQMLDAPVSGGVGGAEAGTLTFIVGGDAETLEVARPILQAMGSNVFHAGGSGAGQIAKICNNMLLAIHMTGTAETLALGVDNGLDPRVLSEIMKVSSGSNWALDTYNPYPGVMKDVPSSNAYTGGFLVDLMRKDLGLALDTAQSSNSSIPFGSLAQNLYQVHRSINDAGHLDFSSIQKLYSPSV